MKKSLLKSKTSVKLSSVQGYGVFADVDFHPGDIIEECRVILFQPESSTIRNYVFQWDNQFEAMSTGFGALYNHADNPNAKYYADKDNGLLIIEASDRISAGDEIFLNYGKKWFETRNLPKLRPDYYRSPQFKRLYSVLSAAFLIGIMFVAWKL